jgi:hypothetical protein
MSTTCISRGVSRFGWAETLRGIKADEHAATIRRSRMKTLRDLVQPRGIFIHFQGIEDAAHSIKPSSID